MPGIEIVLRIVASPLGEFLPGRHGPGKQFFFSDNLVLASIDGRPPADPHQPAGTHSGFVTTLRIADANDGYLPAGGALLQYEATYRLNAVATNPPPGLQQGQVTTRGVLLKTNVAPVDGPTYAITGGTEAYANARGEVTEQANFRRLEIVL